MTIKGYAKIYLKIECQDGSIGSSCFDFDFSGILDEAFFQKIEATCFDAAKNLGYDPVSVSMISKEEYDDIKLNETVVYDISNNSFGVRYSSEDVTKKDLVLLFAVSWGCAKGISISEGDENSVKIFNSYESDELQNLFESWADEYMTAYENGEDPDVMILFESKLSEILSGC